MAALQVPDEAVTKCTSCSTAFNAFIRRVSPLQIIKAEVTQRLSNMKEAAARAGGFRSHEDLVRKLKVRRKLYIIAGLATASNGRSGKLMREVKCPSCTVHLQIVPLIPNKLLELASAYSEALRNIVESSVNKCSKVQAVYIHFGVGGLFQFDPRSKALDDLTPDKFEPLLRKLFQERRIYEPRTEVLIAQEIRTSGDVEKLYADLCEKYLKIGFVCHPIADCPSSLADFMNETTGTKPLMFLIGDHLDVMEKKGLVDKFVKVCDCRDVQHDGCTGKVARYMSYKLKMLVERQSTPKCR